MYSLVQEVAELQQQLQSNEREKEMFRQQLTRKETELTRAEETIRREQQQMRQHVYTYSIVENFIGKCSSELQNVCEIIFCIGS